MFDDTRLHRDTSDKNDPNRNLDDEVRKRIEQVLNTKY